jgi:peptide/nickel transport system permease protein
MRALKSLLLPALSLGLVRAAVLTRMTRSSMLDVLREDYIRTAKSKGLPERIVSHKHAFRNAIIPVVTIIGLQAGDLLAGAIIVENVFYLPGLGFSRYSGDRSSYLSNDRLYQLCDRSHLCVSGPTDSI